MDLTQCYFLLGDLKMSLVEIFSSFMKTGDKFLHPTKQLKAFVVYVVMKEF